MLTIDASVLVAAAVADEPNHEVAAALLREAGRLGLTIHQPTIALVEVAAGIVRRTADVQLAQDALRLLLAMPGAAFHWLDVPGALDAAAVASALRVRAADAVYAAVAHEAGTTLVTLDEELLARAAPLADACTPAAWIARASEDGRGSPGSRKLCQGRRPDCPGPLHCCWERLGSRAGQSG